MRTSHAEVAIDLTDGSASGGTEGTAGSGKPGEVRGVMVRPAEGEGPWPGVVMLHEAWGLDDVMVRQAERLASAGYVVLLPDLLGEGPWLRCMISAVRAMRSERGRPFEIIEACRKVLAADPSCTGRIGVIGFCMGGGFALLSATRGFDASAVNYGMLPKDLDAALVGACPVVGSYGLVDKGLAGAARDLGEALKRAAIPHDVKEYSGAGHSFMNDEVNAPKPFRPLTAVMGAGPNPEAAADAWQRIERFFARFLAS